ncbi:phage tail tape measure protein [Streptomyces showdoensis]|uniref:Phage tail tape measure protein domain-containing protein n=1 Tax=Streptomyces showdoensis TaxID=68268 RepID=A0A2P2GL97_STREW|nr:phage tail tape measure protein [Streptomyces showdoensis]KKZ72276.1 hypothetical protein VO63_19015 [Streptomyces showdoensis]
MTILDELLVRIGMDSSGVDEGAEEVTNRLDGLAGPAAAAGLAAGAVFAVGIAGAMDIAGARSELQKSLDLTSEEAARAGGLAGDVFSDGFGESLDEVTSGLATVTGAMGKLGDFTDAELQDMTKGALGLAKALEVDVADASTAAGQLVKQGLVKDGTEAFDVLTRAAQVLPKSMLADVPAVVQEYGTHFKRIGLDASTAFGMMSQFVKAGGKDIDQAGDILHEFARITSEETDRAKEGFKSLGLDGTAMLADIGKGGKPAADALQLTLDTLRGVEDPAKRAQLGVALFGDMAGEAADALLAMNPETAKAASGMDQAAGASKKLTEAMEKDPAQQMDAAMRTLQMTLGEALLPIVLKASELFSEHKELIKTLAPIILGLAVALGIMAAVIWLVNIAMLANPITWIILGIVALIAVIVLLIAKWDWVKAQLEILWDWISAKAKEIWDPIAQYFTDLWDDITESFNQGLDWIQGLFEGFHPLDWISTNWDKVTSWIDRQWDTITQNVSDSIDDIAGFFGGMWDGITGGLKKALNGAIYLINNAIEGINYLIYGANKIPGVNIPYIPFIPFLAEGGITTGPTLAMIGEGSEQEAVLPLSKLDALINTPAAMAAPSTGRMQPVQVLITPTVNGGAFQDAFQYEVRTRAGSSVARYAGEDE